MFNGQVLKREALQTVNIFMFYSNKPLKCMEYLFSFLPAGLVKQRLSA